MPGIAIAVLTDLHLTPPGAAPVTPTRSVPAETLLRAAIERIGAIGPHVLLLLGDLVEEGSAATAPALYAVVASALRNAGAPAIVLPGNHDGPAFYDEFPRPAIGDFGGFRFVSFLDREEPAWNASRDAAGFELMREARRGYAGPLIALQHVPVFPRNATECPYAYLNAPEVIESMAESRAYLALAGHYHRGFGPVRFGPLLFCATRSLAEEPFCFDVVRTDGRDAEVEHHTLREERGP
jgi:hypothetical protein